MIASSTRPASREAYFALAAATAVLTVAFSFGLFSLPVFYPSFVSQFHWTRAQAAGGASIVLLLIGILGPFIGRLTDRFSPKTVLCTGMLVAAAGLSLLSTVSELGRYYAYCALLGIGTAAVSLVPTSMLIAPWFAAHRGTAVGIINAGVGVGGFLAPNLTRKLIESGGISPAFLGLALCLSVPLLCVLSMVRKRPNGPRAQSLSASLKPSEIVRLPAFWFFGFALFFSAHTLTGIQQHLVLYLTGQGITQANATFAFSILLGASAFGKLIGGWMADKHSARASLLLSIVCLVAGIAGLMLADPRSSMVHACAAIFGLGYGGVFNAPPLIAFEFFGTKGVGTILGMFMMFFGLGTSSGGLLAGYIFDRTQTYMTSFSVDLISCSIAFVLLWCVNRLRNMSPSPLASEARAA